MKTLIYDIKSILTSCGQQALSGKQVTSALEYETIAAETEVVTLTVEGFIIYLYEKAYGETYPTGTLTKTEKDRIYEIYDALKIPRPTL